MTGEWPMSEDAIMPDEARCDSCGKVDLRDLMTSVMEDDNVKVLWCIECADGYYWKHAGEN